MTALVLISRLRHVARGILLIGVGVACNPEGAAEAGTSDARRGDIQSWHVDSVSVMIGGDSVDAPFLVDVIAAFSDQNGRLVVADRGLLSIMVFDGDGKLVRQFGRAGNGPGEFNGLVALWNGTQDSLVSYDVSQRRITWWDSTGQILRTRNLPTALAGSTRHRSSGPIGYISEDRFVSVDIRGTPIQSGIFYDTASISIITLPGSDSSTTRTKLLGQLIWQTRYRAPPGSPGAGTTNVLSLHPTGMVAVGKNAIYFGNGSAWEVMRAVPGQQVIDTIRLPHKRVGLSADLKDAWQATILERGRGNMQQMKAYLTTLPYPDSLPAFDLIVSDDDGGSWVRHFSLFDRDSTAWSVLDGSGKYRGTFLMPSRTRPMSIRGHRFVGVYEELSGVQRIFVGNISSK